ncbi:uncharacterized protein LOC116418911 [Piliocolobus tephrosceles]|uniref:uncharacterized protein LOC116418911 n=1 Tax=Piliocolobus tephrosceles TaxID=591936 RepID=UPI0013017AED|nr:uncharacterized protein LOC116418911 [Piliocolobus tephrosceles]
MSNICSEGCRLSPRPRRAARAHPPAPQRILGLACQGLSRSSAPLSNRGSPPATLKLPKLPFQFLYAPHAHLYVEHSGECRSCPACSAGSALRIKSLEKRVLQRSEHPGRREDPNSPREPVSNASGSSPPLPG